VYGIRVRPDTCSDLPTHWCAFQVEFTTAPGCKIITDGDEYLAEVGSSSAGSSHFCDVITYKQFETLMFWQKEIVFASAMARKWIAEDDLVQLQLAA
jgi:hypothetical protein